MLASNAYLKYSMRFEALFISICWSWTSIMKSLGESKLQLGSNIIAESSGSLWEPFGFETCNLVLL